MSGLVLNFVERFIKEGDDRHKGVQPLPFDVQGDEETEGGEA